MFEVEQQRDPFEPVWSEKQLRDELASRNAELAEANSKVGAALAAQRTAEHRVREAGRALQRLQAAQTRRELATSPGPGPRATRWW